MQNSVIKFLWKRNDPRTVPLLTNSTIEKDHHKYVFFTKEAYDKNSRSWCWYCLSRDVVCKQHQFVIEKDVLDSLHHRTDLPSIINDQIY